MALDPGTVVRSIDNPSRTGSVTNAQPRVRPSGTVYQVRWDDGAIDFVREDGLERVQNDDLSDPYGLVARGRYGRATDLRRNLTYVHLSGRLANLVYSMGITSTDFYPHQYRPLLTLLDSPTSGLLIADEVGLGKTIEAGLIWTEFRARFDMRRLVVVCPAMLREKWRDELRNRFGVDAQIVDARTLQEELSRPSQQIGEGRAWIISYQAARPPKRWAPNAKTPARPTTRWLLADYLRQNAQEEPIVDMVVFDEAHYMRNTETAAWRLGELLRDVSSYQVMLSATPINLHNEDLYNLLHLIDPEHFTSHADFQRLLEANRPLVAARDAALNLESPVEAILEPLQRAADHPLLQESRQIRALLENPPTKEQLASKALRAELADSLERLNLLSHVVTRTRKRDVQERRIQREVKREGVRMNDAERELYEAITEATREYAWANGINDGFLLASPQRQVTSCPAAVARAWVAGGQEVDALIQDIEAEYEGDDGDDEIPMTSTFREFLAAVIRKKIDLAALEREDSKFERLAAVAQDHLKRHPEEKIVLFTTFRATAAYLKRRLEAVGLESVILWGGESRAKQEVIDEIRESRSSRILVSTEVAAEGVDLQFCRVLVNYDLPWNPTRIEQRIGRIDRLGQQSPLIHVWNLYFAETIDERIVIRLFDRLRIFEEALGEAEAVVGETVRKLESDLLRRPLSREEEEQRIEQAAQALENVRLHREQLDQNAAHMMAHGQRIMERIEDAQELARRVTEADLYAYVRDYLEKYVEGFRFLQTGDDPYRVTLQLPASFANQLDDFMRAQSLLGKSSLATGDARVCRFLNRISEAPKRGEEVIHQFHPLIRFITADLRRLNEHFYPVIAVKLARTPEITVPDGTYVFYTRSWVFHGVRDEEVLATSAWCMETGQSLDGDPADALLQHARLLGHDWLEGTHGIDSGEVQALFERAEYALEVEYQEALQRKRNENEDRARFQLASIDNYMNRRLPRLRETLHAHIAANRSSLAKALQGQIDKLLTRMETRRQRVREQERVSADRNFVCAGLIRIQ